MPTVSKVFEQLPKLIDLSSLKKYLIIYFILIIVIDYIIFLFF